MSFAQARAKKELEHDCFVDNMLVIMNFCKEIIRHPERTMDADPGEFGCFSLLTLNFEL